MVAQETDDGYFINFYTTTYLYYITHDSLYPVNDAQEKLAMFFYLENYAFGRKEFYNIPPSLFDPGTPVDSLGNKAIFIRDVDTSQLRTSSYICVGVICSICYGLDPTCDLSYEVCTYDPGSTNPGGSGPVFVPTGGGSSNTPVPPPPPPCPGQGQARNWYEKIPPRSAPPCTPIPPAPSAPYVNEVNLNVSGLVDPCMAAIIAMLGPNGTKTELMKAYQNANSGPNNTTFNISFVTNNNLVNANGQPIPGHTDVVMNNNVANVTISLNNAYMATASQEFRMTVLIHELMHTVLEASTTLSSTEQHIQMFLQYVDDIALSVRAYYPLLNNINARALAMQGFDDVLFDSSGAVNGQYNDYAIAQYFMDIDESKTRAAGYFDGTGGTDC